MWLALVAASWLCSPAHGFPRSPAVTWTRTWHRTYAHTTASDLREDAALPRLQQDVSALFQFVEQNGGVAEVVVHQQNAGWGLRTSSAVRAGDTVATVPKNVCIFSDPDKMGTPLGAPARALLSHIDPSLWRLRLAVALLSERVRPSSFYRAYMRNMPFEFWGIPLFFGAQDFTAMQDPALMQATRERCRYLTDFLNGVVAPLQKSAADPFYGYSVDINALGWGFACAASRALRLPSDVGEGAVLVPLLDLAAHSLRPSFEVADGGDSFLLRALVDAPAGAEVTISYGPLGNEALLSDFGFTLDANPHDRFRISVDAGTLDLARQVTGLSGGGNSSRHRSVGYNGDKLEERRLYSWQVEWLRAMGMYGPDAQVVFAFRGTPEDPVDPRLWGYLRVLYARSEQDLAGHGWDPFTLQASGSVASLEAEAAVIKTLVGLLALMLRSYSTDLSTDEYCLRAGLWDAEAEAGGGGRGTPQDDFLRIARHAMRLPATPSPSISVRRLQETVASSRRAFTSVNATLERSLEDIIRSQVQGPAAEHGPAEREVAPSPATGGVEVEDGLDGMGLALSTNVREALRYRIRQKRQLADAIYHLGQLHGRVQSARGVSDDLLPQTVVREAGDRRARIKDLLDDMGPKDRCSYRS